MRLFRDIFGVVLSALFVIFLIVFLVSGVNRCADNLDQAAKDHELELRQTCGSRCAPFMPLYVDRRGDCVCRTDRTVR